DLDAQVGQERGGVDRARLVDDLDDRRRPVAVGQQELAPRYLAPGGATVALVASSNRHPAVNVCQYTSAARPGNRTRLSGIFGESRRAPGPIPGPCPQGDPMGKTARS